MTFDLIFIDGHGIVMDYIPVPSLVILVSAVLVLSCGQTVRQNHNGGSTLYYTHATTVCVRKIAGVSVFGAVVAHISRKKIAGASAFGGGG